MRYLGAGLGAVASSATSETRRCRPAWPRVRPCAEANLGGDLSSAQLKREHLHLQLLGAAPADADWFVTTEQDVWWHAARLHAYLEAIERKFPDAHAAPFFAGGYEGPFLVMNRRFVEAVVGNATFVDRCRAALLEFLAQPHVHPHKGDKGDTGGKRRLGGRAKCHRADGSSCAAEAPYNNDLLVRWCAQRSGAHGQPGCPTLRAFAPQLPNGGGPRVPQRPPGAAPTRRRTTPGLP